MIRDLKKIKETDLEYFKSHPNEISYERKPYPNEFVNTPQPPSGYGHLLTKAKWAVVIHIAPNVVLAIPTLKDIAIHSDGRVKGFRVSR